MSPANAATALAGSPYDGSDGKPDTSAGDPSPDLPSGQGDDSYTGGAKEDHDGIDDPCPEIADGSIPPKADIINVYAATADATDDSGDHFLYLAWERQDRSRENGTVAISFELNQSGEIGCNGVNFTRTVGDKLVSYQLHGNDPAGAITISVSTWDGTAWVGEKDLVLPVAESSIGEERLFGEMVINLEKSGIFTEGDCDNFASVSARSRASSQEPGVDENDEGAEPQLKDLVAPIPLHVAACGALTVTKTVTGGKAGDKFDFTVDCPGTDKGATFSLAHGESKTIEDIPVGTECTVTEADPGSFWTVTRTINATAAGSGPATVVIDPDNESVEFINAAKPNGITLDKKVNGADHAIIGDALVARTGDALNYTVTVTNTGDVPLKITALADSLYTGFPAAGDCPQGVGSTLAPDASFTCTYSVAMAGPANNVAKVIAVDESNREVSDDDQTFVTPVEVLGITLEQPALAVLPRTGTSARDIALVAFGLAGFGLGLRRLSRRPKNTA